MHTCIISRGSETKINQINSKKIATCSTGGSRFCYVSPLLTLRSAIGLDGPRVCAPSCKPTLLRQAHPTSSILALFTSSSVRFLIFAAFHPAVPHDRVKLLRSPSWWKIYAEFSAQLPRAIVEHSLASFGFPHHDACRVRWFTLLAPGDSNFHST